MADVRWLKMLDITKPEHVELRIRSDGKVLWVTVDGQTVLRICQIPTLVLVDDRPLLVPNA